MTEPAGSVLGTSGIETVTVLGGEMACVSLFDLTGFADTSNPGGEYKVWVSMDATFPNPARRPTTSRSSRATRKRTRAPTGPPTATLNVDEVLRRERQRGPGRRRGHIIGWKVNIHDGINLDRFTPVTMIVDPDDYTVLEYTPIETNWYSTTDEAVNVTLAADDVKTVTFGNVCTVPARRAHPGLLVEQERPGADH